MAKKRCREDEPATRVSQKPDKRRRPDQYASSSTDSDSIFSEVNPNSSSDTDGSSFHEAQQENHSDLADFFADSDNAHPPEYYIQLLSSLSNHDYKGTKYADTSIALLDRVEEKWHGFCHYIRKDPIQTYKTLSVQLCHIFLEWVLNQTRGKNGRLLKGIKTQSSFHTFWKVFRLVYERANSQKIPDEIQIKIRPLMQELAKKYQLTSEGHKKATAYIEDLALVVETAVTTQKRFGHGRHRIELCLFLQLAGFTANRPGALLDLRYQDIRVTLIRDPTGGPHRILIEFTFEFTKTFLGVKDPLTFPIPEILFDPSLVLSPHVFLLSLLFGDGAFKEWEGTQLVSAKQLLHLHIRPGCNEFPLLLKPELNDVPVFRQISREFEGSVPSKDQPLPYSTILRWIQRVGTLRGFRQLVHPYVFRRGAGKALDDSPNVSDSLRNLIMMHADTRTFLKYYLSREVNVDVAGTMRQQDPQQRDLVAPQEDIMRAACRMSRTIDPNRPIELTTEQSSSVNELPEIQEIIRQRDEVGRRLGRPMSQHKGTPDYKLHQKLTSQLSSMRQKARAELLKKIQYGYDQEQPMRELQLQLELAALNLPEDEFQQRLQSARSKFSNTVNRSLEGFHDLPLPLKRFAEAILTLPKPTLEEEMLRRTEAIDAGADVCRFEEGETSRIAHNKRRRTKEAVDDTTEHEPKSDNVHPALESKLQEAIRAVMNDTRPKYCFICVGNPNLDIERRTQKFYEHGDVTKHIRRKHLKNLTVTDSPACRIHSETFPHAQAFQRHAIDTHSTVT